MPSSGLTEIYAPYEIIAGVKRPLAQLDLIFVHGLNPKANTHHGRQTWTHPNGIFWPGDILPKLLPKARVLFFEYNSQVIGSGAADLGIHDHADNLLDCYRAVRGSSNVPTIFICHSLGGLIVKQALSRATIRSPGDPGMMAIKTSTYGIIFFGTPHRGGNGVGVGQVVEKIVKTFTGGGTNNLLQSLKKGGQLSLYDQDSFRPYIEDFKYISIVEGRPMGRIGIIVSRESGTLGADMRRETIIALDADHSEICKFEGDEGMFAPIKPHLLRMATLAVQSNLDSTLIANSARTSQDIADWITLHLSSVEYSAVMGGDGEFAILRRKINQPTQQLAPNYYSSVDKEPDDLEPPAHRLEELATPTKMLEDAPNNRLRESIQVENREPKAPYSGKAIVEIRNAVILVMGVTGTGKSSFVAAVTKQKVQTGAISASCTSRIDSFDFEHKGHRITLVDFPGFDHSDQFDVAIFRDAAQWMQETYERGVQITGIIYFHRIDNARFSGTQVKDLEVFRRLCGMRAFPNVTLVTTFWSGVEQKVGLEREKELIMTFWADMINCGSRVFRFDGKRESGLEIIDVLLLREKVILQVQRELVLENKNLADTAAGAYLNEALLFEKQRHEDELKRLEEEMRIALEEQDRRYRKEVLDLENEFKDNARRDLGLLDQADNLETTSSETCP